jgi:hypothetical protein
MSNPEIQTALELFFKALVDSDRLQIAGVLARQPQTAEHLATQLNLKPVALARHLDKLMEAGLVRAEVKPSGTQYGLQLEAARATAAALTPRPSAPLLEDDLEAFDRQVLRHHLLPSGALKEIPAQDKKFLVILRYIHARLDTGRRYTEKQLNDFLGQFHADVATLRRGLIDWRLMQRTVTGSEYWRNE